MELRTKKIGCVSTSLPLRQIKMDPVGDGLDKRSKVIIIFMCIQRTSKYTLSIEHKHVYVVQKILLSAQVPTSPPRSRPSIQHSRSEQRKGRGKPKQRVNNFFFVSSLEKAFDRLAAEVGISNQALQKSLAIEVGKFCFLLLMLWPLQ